MYNKIVTEKEQINRLKEKDKKMALLIQAIGNIDRSYIPDPFIALVNSIVYQQLAIKAANTIWERFKLCVEVIDADHILQKKDEELRACGLSKNKITYIKNIAQASINKTIDFNEFPKMSDEDIIDTLIKVKGIGVWSAEMFLIFSLNRKNVLSYNDLGIRKGIQWLYNLKEEPTREQFNQYKKLYSPYNTLASFYLWEISTKYYKQFDCIEDVVNDYYVLYVDSPIGLLELQSDDLDLVCIKFVKEKRYIEKQVPVLEKTKQQLKEYFEGTRKTFDIPMKREGTVFQQKVWEALTHISYGRQVTYKDIAVDIGNEKACRAVGNANNKNNFPIIIPCHRVIGSSGKLVGYAGEIWRKKWLLDHEIRYNI